MVKDTTKKTTEPSTPSPPTTPGVPTQMAGQDNRPEMPNLPPVAVGPKPPAATDPEAASSEAVSEVNGKKIGWQEPAIYPAEVVRTPPPCAHMSVAAARKSLDRREIGAEFVCHCGKEYVVAIGDGGNKILKEKEA